jgi:hypothetical protein
MNACSRITGVKGRFVAPDRQAEPLRANQWACPECRTSVDPTAALRCARDRLGRQVYDVSSRDGLLLSRGGRQRRERRRDCYLGDVAEACEVRVSARYQPVSASTSALFKVSAVRPGAVW